MRPWLMRVLLVGASWLAIGPAWSETIVEVLQRSQDMRLQGFALADERSPQVGRIRASFQTLLLTQRVSAPVELRVIRGDTVAETLQGCVVVANESLGDLSEGERLFVLAHELGHVAQSHWLRMSRLYQKYIPGIVAPAQTEAVGNLLGREASALSHRQEYEADAYALRVLRSMGHSHEDVLAVFMRMGSRQDTVTHPGTRKRVANLRQFDQSEPGDAAAEEFAE